MRSNKGKPKKKRKSNAGAPSALNNELFLKIRKIVLGGGQQKEIAEGCGIPKNTVDFWYYTDYQGFRIKLDSWRHERMLRTAEGNIEEIANMDTKTLKVTKMGVVECESPALVGVKANMNQFIAETLGKHHYSKRMEQTGKDGGPIEHSISQEDKERLKSMI